MSVGNLVVARAREQSVRDCRRPHIEPMAAGVEEFGQEAIEFRRREFREPVEARAKISKARIGRLRRGIDTHEILRPCQSRVRLRGARQQSPMG